MYFVDRTIVIPLTVQNKLLMNLDFKALTNGTVSSYSLEAASLGVNLRSSESKAGGLVRYVLVL